MITPEGLDRKFCEICALSELKNAPALHGDIWVREKPRQFRDFDDYLLPAEKFAALKREQATLPRRSANGDQYGRAFAAAGRNQLAAVTRGQDGEESCPMPSSHRVGAENHPAGCGGAGGSGRRR